MNCQRHTSLLVVFTLIVVIGFSGCGKNEESLVVEKAEPASAQAKIEVTDARGRVITLKNPAIRIVSLLPSMTEFIFELDKGHLLIGRTSWCRFPKAALEVEVVGALDSPVVESLVRLNPDLIIASAFLRDEQVKHLETLGLTVVIFDHQNWETMVHDLEILGKLLDNPGDIKTLVAWLVRHRQAVVDNVEEFGPEEPVKTAVLYAMDNLYTAGRGTFIDEMIQLAGGKNLASDLSSPWPTFSMEGLLEKQPEVLLISTESGDTETLIKKIKSLSKTEVWGQINAVKNNRVYLLDGDTLAVPGPRQIIALTQIAAALHPDLFDAPQELIHVNLLSRPRLP